MLQSEKKKNKITTNNLSVTLIEIMLMIAIAFYGAAILFSEFIGTNIDYNNHYSSVDSYDIKKTSSEEVISIITFRNQTECLTVNKELPSLSRRKFIKLYTSFADSCEFIWAQAVNFHGKYSPDGGEIKGVSIVQTKTESRYLPAYMNDNSLVLSGGFPVAFEYKELSKEEVQEFNSSMPIRQPKNTNEKAMQFDK